MVDWNDKRIIKFILFFLLFFWMVSPLIIPDDYSGYTEEEIKVVEATFWHDDPEIGWIQRISVNEVAKYDSKYQVKIIHHTIFNIPAIESNITVIQSANVLRVTEIDFKKLTPFVNLYVLIQILIFNIIIFGLPILSIYFVVKITKKYVK